MIYLLSPIIEMRIVRTPLHQIPFLPKTPGAHLFDRADRQAAAHPTKDHMRREGGRQGSLESAIMTKCESLTDGQITLLFSRSAHSA